MKAQKGDVVWGGGGFGFPMAAILASFQVTTLKLLQGEKKWKGKEKGKGKGKQLIIFNSPIVDNLFPSVWPPGQNRKRWLLPSDGKGRKMLVLLLYCWLSVLTTPSQY